MARRRAALAELEEAERAAERRDRLAKHLAVIDRELEDHPSLSFDDVSIRTPCGEPWRGMKGGDAVRHCLRCGRDVHDPARMTNDELDGLIERSLDAQLHRRPDGRLVEGRCPATQPELPARAMSAVVKGTLLGSLFTAGALVGGAMFVAIQPAPVVVTRSVQAAAPIEPPAAPVAVAVAQPLEPLPPAPPPGPIETADLDRHIRWIAPQAWEIDRVLLERAFMHTSGMMRSPRVIPHERGGRVVGLKIYGVRPDSMLGRLGIRNGDLVADINGYSLADPNAALEAYVRLRSADALFVRVERRGEELLHVYRIRG